MFSQPEHHHNLSLRLSQVLDDIGVNKTMILKRRRTWMLCESLQKMYNQLIPEFRGFSLYHFGSQTEGSTTLGLHSDVDNLVCGHDIRIIQDWSVWEHLPDKLQYVMVQDETTSPGYCLLQHTRHDAPLPVQDIHYEHYTIDNRGRVLLRHSFSLGHISEENGQVRHGPARTILGGPGHYDSDLVWAFHCSSWPKEADPWLHQQNVSGWPTEEMKKYSAEQGCFLVPVSSRTGVNQDLEWRISTSMAERCLMLNLSVTQMNCYILMKMIFKTFLKPKCGDAISSFMCKNILFHCIAESENSSTWNKSSLLTCFSKCLQSLLNCVLTDHCPHFMIPGNNLLAGKLSADIKHQLVDVMCSLTENIGQSLLSIQIDDLGTRLHVKSGGISHVHLHTPFDISITVASQNNQRLAYELFQLLMWFNQSFQNDISRNVASAYQILIDRVFKLSQVYRVGNTLEQVAVSLCAPFHCSQIGCVIASEDIQLAQVVSAEAVRWFTLGLNSDISSGKLKLASALYCAGDLERCEIILDALRIRLSQSLVMTICCCNGYTQKNSQDFDIVCYEKNEDVIKHNMAFCVTYLPCEVNCVPRELRFEMFRSTAEDRPYRDEDDDWMDWAVVDSVPYLYFLQYKVYTQLHRPAEQRQALDNLIRTIDTDEDLCHRETALNLLGQCMEQENRMNAALCCYMMSLNVRERNNAAKWHICRLLAGVC